MPNTCSASLIQLTHSVNYILYIPVPDIFPEHHFQVGATPEYTEKAKDHP